jgi:TetR/AcrR family transcriptional regulator, transcriptional repressor of bet genes
MPMSDPQAIYFQLFPTTPSKGDLKKLEVVQEAMRQIAHTSAAGVSLESIGKALKMRRSHVIYYFPDFDSLVFECAKLATATAQHLIVERIKKANTPKKKILAVLDANYDWITKYPEQASLMLLFISDCRRSESSRALQSAILSAGVERLKGILFLALKSEKEAKILALSIQSLIAGILLNQGSVRTVLSPTQKSEGREVLERLLESYGI